jgi:hypothetical protein
MDETTNNDNIMRVLGRIEGLLQGLSAAQLQHHDRMNHHDTRIAKLERARAWIIGAAAAAGAGSAKVFTLLSTLGQ